MKNKGTWKGTAEDKERKSKGKTRETQRNIKGQADHCRLMLGSCWIMLRSFRGPSTRSKTAALAEKCRKN